MGVTERGTILTKTLAKQKFGIVYNKKVDNAISALNSLENALSRRGEFFESFNLDNLKEGFDFISSFKKINVFFGKIQCGFYQHSQGD